MKHENLILAEIEVETLRFTRTIARLRRALADARHHTKLKQPIWTMTTDTIPLAHVADRIIEAVALVTGVTPHAIRGRDKHAHIVAARHTTWWLIRHLMPQFTLEAVGSHFRLSHGSVYHAIKSIESRRITEPKFAAQLQTLETTLQTELSTILPLNLSTKKAA